MYYTYILKCKLHGRIKYYKGITNNLERRMMEHIKGIGGYTKIFNGNIELIYFESFRTRKEARRREIKLKKLTKKKIKELVR